MHKKVGCIDTRSKQHFHLYLLFCIGGFRVRDDYLTGRLARVYHVGTAFEKGI